MSKIFATFARVFFIGISIVPEYLFVKNNLFRTRYIHPIQTLNYLMKVQENVNVCFSNIEQLVAYVLSRLNR